MLKVIGASSLAFFMGSTLCGVLIAPMNATKAGILGETNSLQSDESNSALNLNLNPETDETIYTTENGIEIKSYNLNGSGVYGSLQYFTLGSYEGKR